MIEARRFKVFGRVQGVGFRYFVERTARRFRLQGWVKNCRDGSVEAFAQGEQLDHFEAELRQGPAMSYVERVQVIIEDPNPNYFDFSITF